MKKSKTAISPPPRRPHGSQLWSTNLDESEVYKIRRMHAAGWSILALAKTYKVTWLTMKRITSGISWKHVRPLEPEPRSGHAPRLIPWAAVKNRTGLSRRTVARLTEREEFPPSRPVPGTKLTLWVESEIDAWIEARVQGGGVKGKARR